MKNKRRYILITISIVVCFLVLLSYIFLTEINVLHNLTVNIQAIQLEDIGLSSMTLKLTLLFSNPTAQDLSRLQGVFDIYIADTYVGNGTFPPFSLSVNSQKNKVIYLTLYYTNLANAVLEGLRQREFDLTLKGEIQTTTFFDLIEIKHNFSTSSTFP